MRTINILAAAVAASALLGGAPAQAQEKTITLKPAKQEGTAKSNLLLGPFGIYNYTEKNYTGKVFPAYLKQFRNGGVVLDQSPAKLRDAKARVKVAISKYSFKAGENHSVPARLIRPTKDRNFYGAISFQANPTDKSGQGAAQIRQAFALNASVLLAPQPRYVRIGGETEPCFAKQLGPQKLGYYAPLRNTGNIHNEVTGRFKITDAAGKVVSRPTVQGNKLFPTFIVDFPAQEKGKLGKGEYKLTATLKARGETWTTSCSMRLSDVNTLEYADAEIKDFPAPTVYFDDEWDLKATYKNSGSIRFAPKARVTVRYASGVKRTQQLGVYPLQAAETSAGADGSIFGAMKQLPTRDSFELQLDLLTADGKRVLDTQTVVAVQQVKPSVTEQWGKWIAIAVAALLLALILFFLRRRRKREQEEKNALRARLAELEGTQTDDES